MQKHPNFQTNKFNKVNEQSIKASSHFLGLQCVLDKYQHQNEILSQKVSFLIEQNKRLRLGSSYNHSGDYIKYEKGLVKYKQNYQSLLRHTNTTDLKNTLNKLQKQTYNIKSYELDKEQSVYRNINKNKSKIEYDNITKTSRKQKKQRQQYRQNLINKTNQISKLNQRKCSSSLQKYNRNIINNTHSSNDQKQTQRYSYRNVNNNRIKTQPNTNINITNNNTSNTNINKNISIINNNKKSNQPNNKQPNNQITKKQTNKQSIKQINRQAYLQDQTIFLDSQDISIQENKDNQKIRNSSHNNNNTNNNANTTNKNKQIDYEKLPIFIQASFGNLDEKDEDSGNSNSNSNSNYNYNYNQSQNQYQYRYKNQHENQNKIKKQFSIQSLQNQLKQKNKDFLKSNFRLDKTQQQKKSFFLPPYLTSQSKNYLNFQQKQKQKQKQNIQITSGKKTNSPYIKSDYKLTQPKTQLAKILHHQRKKQQVKYQIKEQQQQFLDNVVQPNSTKKTFLNVISRKPKIKIFLK